MKSTFLPAAFGVGLCSTDAPLVSLDHPGCCEFSRDFIPRKPSVYLHLYNNMWSTSFPMWCGGSWSTKVRLWPVSSTTAESSLVTPSLETCHRTGPGRDHW